MKVWICVFLVLFLAFAVASQSDVTPTESKTRTMKRAIFTWVSDATGDASGTTTAPISGLAYRAVFKPAIGSSSPSNNYDVVLNDSYGVDVLQGKGANLSNTIATDVGVILTDGTDGNTVPVAVDDLLTLTVSNAGNAKGGVVVLYYR